VLRLADKWVWDFWLARDGVDYHLFYLQAPRSTGDPEQRHWNVSIGHAVSEDLIDWEILPDALAPSLQSDRWDNYTTWTGSVIRYNGLWYLFYTGSKREEQGHIQRIGLATSKDLIFWEKHPANPLLSADSEWYETYNPEVWHEQAWRDPWVFQDPEQGDFHAFITARSKDGPPDGRGVIAHARSPDLVRWEVLPPVSESGAYGHMEVPQRLEIEGRTYLLYSVTKEVQSQSSSERPTWKPLSGMYYMTANQSLGPFRFSTERTLYADTACTAYAGKLVPGPRGDWRLLATRLFTPEGEFIGEIGDPLPLTVERDGDLSVEGAR
jgi:beta-fructofuranosidase